MTIRHSFLFCLAALAGLFSCVEKPAFTASFDIIPAPEEVTLDNGGAFILTTNTPVICESDDEDMLRNAAFLKEYLHLEPACDQSNTKRQIVLELGLEAENPEAYLLTVSKKQILIKGATAAGVFYGIQTLRKAVPATWEGSVAIPSATVKDAPRFSYRGAHFDPCRHFFTIEETKTYLDMMAMHNMNRLHWHISEDQGWRIEIKKYPKLTEVGAYRPGTVVGHYSDANIKDDSPYDGIPVSGFYTQEEAREIVRYAADRYITVIPEIDLPGHMVAALTAYPEYGCTGGPYAVWGYWGVSKDILCIGKDKTMKFLEDVLDEITQIFPSEYIHIGGDEAPKVRWKNCPDCQRKIKELGLKDDEHSSKEEKFQGYVVNHIEKFLAERGRKIIGWDEILEGEVTPNATIMSWRGEKGGIAAARLDHDVIMAPNTYFYLDYYQGYDKQYEPDAIGGYLPLGWVYSYSPMPVSLTPEEQKHIIGVQANLWTEYISTFSQCQYMVLPRWAAVSEIQWSDQSKKDFDCFLHRLPKMLDQYEAAGYNFARNIFEANTAFKLLENDSVEVKLFTLNDAPIHYTTDGSEPTLESPLYEAPFTVQAGTLLRAIVDREGGDPHPLYRSVLPRWLKDKPW